MGWAAGSPGGSTEAVRRRPAGWRAWLLDEEARCWMGREEGGRESDGRGRRQALIKNEQRAASRGGRASSRLQRG